MMRSRRLLLAAAAVLLAGTTAVTVAPASAEKVADYVSLGDSFIAFGSYATTAMSIDCAQGTDDVGHLVAARMSGTTFTDLACGGTTSDTVQKKAAERLSPATKFVSISTGGNDNGLYGDLITNCMVTAAACTPAARHAAYARLGKLGPQLDRVYSSVRRAAPNARVVVLGYLRLLPDNARGCYLETTVGQGNVDFGNAVQRRLNSEIAKAADRAGFTVVNQWQDGSHSVCAPDGERHVSMSGLERGDQALAFHPTLTGRKYAAGLIADAFAGGR